MIGAATLHIDLAKIEANARSVCGRLAPTVSVAGVTKVTCGHPGVARAMLAGGATIAGGLAPAEPGASARGRPGRPHVAPADPDARHRRRTRSAWRTCR